MNHLLLDFKWNQLAACFITECINKMFVIAAYQLGKRNGFFFLLLWRASVTNKIKLHLIAPLVTSIAITFNYEPTAFNHSLIHNAVVTLHNSLFKIILSIPLYRCPQCKRQWPLPLFFLAGQIYAVIFFIFPPGSKVARLFANFQVCSQVEFAPK